MSKEDWSTHHHGFDFKRDQETAACRCGLVRTNPYYQVGMDQISRMPLIKKENK